MNSSKGKKVAQKFNFAIKSQLYSILLLSFVVLGCSSGPGSLPISGQWQQSGLQNISVNSLNQFADAVYAATDSGLYRSGQATANWISLGLKEKDVLDIAFLPGEKLLAAIRVSGFSNGNPSLFLSTDNGQHWQTYINDYGGNTDVTMIEKLESISEPSDTLFAGVGVMLARSQNGAKNWHVLEERWDAWGGKLNFLAADPYHKGVIWIGGHDPFFLPMLARFTNKENNWKGIDIGDTPQDIWISPEDADKILVSTGGIHRSTDGGENWEQVFSKAGIRTFTHSARNPETVYASGRNANGTLFFAASGDFGDSWETVEWQDSPASVQVDDIVSVIVDGQEVLYFATNKGVYSYSFEE